MAKLEQGARQRFLDREWDGIKRTFDGGGGPWHIEIPAKARKMLTQHEDQQDEIKLTALVFYTSSTHRSIRLTLK